MMTHFEKYLRLLIDLHVAMVANDEVLADNIRDQMDDSGWYDMSDKEQNIMNNVSTVLYGDFSIKNKE